MAEVSSFFGVQTRQPAPLGRTLWEGRAATRIPSAQRPVAGTVVPSATRVPLSIRTFGSLEVSLDGEPLELPASRRTRALLAFLVLSGSAQRRERLCELFWETPRDPRGSLRWSLCKLRPLLNAGGFSRLLTSRERVQISPEAIAVDLCELRACANDADASAAALSRVWELSNQRLLEDCELPEHPDFMAWLQHQRNEIVRLRTKLARRLAQLPELPAAEAEQWAQRWLREVPGDARAAEQVVMAQRRIERELLSLVPASTPEPTVCQAASAALPATAGTAVEPKQLVRFVQANDGTALAWASLGAANNLPLVKAASWPVHVELDQHAPMWSPLVQELTRVFRFIRYDERGCGLSGQDVSESSFATAVSDLEKVVDAAGLDRFPLLGMGQAAAVSIEYAVRHPERVSHLILMGGYAAGWRHTASSEEIREREAIMVLTEAGWDRDNPAYRSLLSRSLMPDANSEELNWFDEFQRRTTSPKHAARFLEQFSQVDVRHRLKDVKVPTQVFHSRGDTVVPVDRGRELAKGIANAEFVVLDSNNHLLLGRERAASVFVQNVRQFLARD